MSLPSVSVIVTTYNWPQALARVLAGLKLQRYKRMEVIIADDGSSDATAEVIRHYRKDCDFPLSHCWQPDEGFRAAMIRNRAVAKASHDYIIFIDGDCIPMPHFVHNHAKLAQKGWLVSGARILLSDPFTKEVLSRELAIEQWSHQKWLMAGFSRKCNRFCPTLKLPLGKLRDFSPYRWQGVKTCNLGLWREDFIAVNGLDENFTGWGFEDSDLVIRLQRKGIKKKFGKYAVEVLHLWHPSQDRSRVEANAKRLQKTLECSQVRADKGIEQYINYDNC